MAYQNLTSRNHEFRDLAAYRGQRFAGKARGLSLIELMVAITIGSIILIGLIGFASSASRDQAEIIKTEQQLDNGRFALSILADDLKHAGFYGFFHDEMTAPTAAPDPCSTAVNDATFEDAARVAIQVFNGADDSPLSACVPDADYLEGSDIVVVRRADTGNPIAPAAVVANNAYIQGSLIDYLVGDSSESWQAGLPIRRYKVHIYYVDCSVNAADVDCGGKGRTVASTHADFNNFVPTLKRLTLREDGTPGWVTEPLAEGINNLQIDYGIDTDGDGIPQLYISAPTLGQMVNIVTARIFLLARAGEPSIGYAAQEQKQYSLGLSGNDDPYGDGSPYGDGFKRKVLSTTVQIVNIGTRRASL